MILIGLRAAGKTTMGRELADGLQIKFQDLDDLALTESGAASVAEVFVESGEPAGSPDSTNTSATDAAPDSVKARSSRS